MLELLALLLPVAAASGWYAAQKRFRSDYLHQRTRAVQESYTRGVGLLLQDKIDEALDALSPVLQSDAEALELRLAVGHLFRKKGQVEKALAVHERLSGQHGLNPEQSEFVSFQLGMDYLAAGLLDRAETAFSALLDTDRYRAESLRQLLKIYQRERDWWRAIECTRQLKELQKLPRGETVAQFYCELAATAQAAGRRDEAARLLQLALRDDPQCVRAAIARGKLFMESGDWAGALEAFSQVERQQPVFISEVLDLAVSCFEQLRRESDLRAYLRHVFFVHRCENAACLLVERLQRDDDRQTARDFLQEALARQPSLELSRKLLKLLSLEIQEVERTALHLILRSIPEPTADSSRYRCQRCGFEARELHWNCPSCHGWETIKPKG